jgi:hypothetical protein
MDADTSKALAAFGFLTVLHSPEHGWFGGYLVLSPQGRPLEFRCSTPVAPTRAQEILYGATLRPYLFAEVIGQSLVAGSELPVELILTDQSEMLSLALLRPEEVVLVEPLRAADPDENNAKGPLNAGVSFEFEGFRVTLSATTLRDGDWYKSKLGCMAAHVELAEPFDRVRAALREAHADHPDEPENGHVRPAA